MAEDQAKPVQPGTAPFADLVGKKVVFRMSGDKPGHRRVGRLVAVRDEFLVVQPLRRMLDDPEPPAYLANRRYLVWIGRVE